MRVHIEYIAWRRSIKLVFYRALAIINRRIPLPHATRFYLSRAQQSFGSHSILNEYIRKHWCKRILEIGVFNGENAKTMVRAANQNVPAGEVEYYGFDFFSGSQFHHVEQQLARMGCTFTLFKGPTNITLPGAVKTLPKMDLIFIDGGKSYSEVKSDWEHSKRLMHDRTAVFVHNYDFSGVRKMVDAISRAKYQVMILHPPSDVKTAYIRKMLTDAD